MGETTMPDTQRTSYVERRSAGAHDAHIRKVTGPGVHKTFTPECSCGWMGEPRGRELGRGREAAVAELDGHLRESAK